MSLSVDGNLSRRLIVIWCFLLIVLSGLFAYLSIKNDYHLSCNDTFYYLSVADNMLQSKLCLSGTTDPPGPIVTPQNGIVFIFCLLRKFSLSHAQCLHAFLVLNGLCLFLSIIPLIKIAKALGVTEKLSLLAVVTVYLGNIRFFQWMYFSPINDMIFLCISLFFISMLFKMDQHLCPERQDTSTIRWSFGLSLLLCVILPHFRVNSFFIPAAGIIAALFVRRFSLIKYFVVQFAVMLISLYGSYFLFRWFGYDIQFIEMQQNVTGFDVGHFIFRLFPEAIFRELSSSGNVLYLPFYLVLVLSFFQGVREKKIALLMITFICMMTMGLTLAYIVPLSRYLWPVTPFLYILVLRCRRLKVIGLLFVCAVVLGSFMTIYDGIHIPGRVAFWQYAGHKVSRDNDKTALIAQAHRSAWYFTGTAAFKDSQYSWEQLHQSRILYLGGKLTYIREQQEKVNRLALENNYQVYWKDLTADYQDKEGRKLYRLEFTAIDN